MCAEHRVTDVLCDECRVKKGTVCRVPGYRFTVRAWGRPEACCGWGKIKFMRRMSCGCGAGDVGAPNSLRVWKMLCRCPSFSAGAWITPIWNEGSVRATHTFHTALRNVQHAAAKDRLVPWPHPCCHRSRMHACTHV
eukprot:357299-Chlamydomonas_euryale.AAC.4